MWRGIVSIVALLIIAGSLLVIVPIMVLPNTLLHSFVPFLKPLHQAIACTDGETMEYDDGYFEGVYEVHFRCVNAAGRERDVDDVLLRPAYYSIGTLCLGVLLMLAPLYVAVRQGVRGETGAEMQSALQQSYKQLSQIPAAMTQGGDPTLNASGQQQLDALNKLRQQGLINADAYETAKQIIYEGFSNKPS